MILGLDISTSCTGLAVVSDSGLLIESTYLEFPKKTKKRPALDLYEKSDLLMDQIREMYRKYPIDSVYAESPLMKMSGASSAHTIAILIKFNGMITSRVYSEFNSKTELILPQTTRKLCGIKRQKGTKDKVTAFKWIVDNVKGFVVEYARTGNVRKQSYDESDAIVVALAGSKLEQTTDNPGEDPR